MSNKAKPCFYVEENGGSIEINFEILSEDGQKTLQEIADKSEKVCEIVKPSEKGFRLAVASGNHSALEKAIFAINEEVFDFEEYLDDEIERIRNSDPELCELLVKVRKCLS